MLAQHKWSRHPVGSAVGFKRSVCVVALVLQLIVFTRQIGLRPAPGGIFMADAVQVGKRRPCWHFLGKCGMRCASIAMGHFNGTTCCRQWMHQHPPATIHLNVMGRCRVYRKMHRAQAITLDTHGEVHACVWVPDPQDICSRAGYVCRELQIKSLRLHAKLRFIHNRRRCAPAGIAQQERNAMPYLMTIDEHRPETAILVGQHQGSRLQKLVGCQSFLATKEGQLL